MGRLTKRLKFLLSVIVTLTVVIIIYKPFQYMPNMWGLATLTDHHITYQIDRQIPKRYHVSQAALRRNYMAAWNLYTGKQKLVAVREYEEISTFRSLKYAAFPYQVDTTFFAFPVQTRYIPAQYLHPVKPVIQHQKLPNIPYYLNSFDGYHRPEDYKMTPMRVWNTIPEGQPNTTSNDVAPYMYQQLYATQTATNNLGRTYLKLRTKSKNIGWVRKGSQLVTGKYISPVKRLLHLQKHERLTQQIQPLSMRHGYHLSQRVYNVYDRHGKLSRSLAMSYLFYPNLFIIKNNRVVTAKFYDHHYHVVKTVHNSDGLKKVTVNPKPGTLDYWNDNSRYATFNSKKTNRLYHLTDGLEDPESTYGTISVSHSGYAVMKSSGMASLE